MGMLDGKVAIVTGVAGGLGAAAADAYAREGATVVGAGHTVGGAEAVAEALSEAGHSAIGLQVDVGDEASVRGLIEATIERYGQLDILHNNAAATSHEIFSRDTEITDIDPDIFAQIFRVNSIGYALMAKHSVPHMIARGGGVVINISATDGIRAPLGRPMYGASKSAVDALTRSIATQYGRQGIRALGISPGPIVTPAARKLIPAAMLDRLSRQLLTPRDGIPEDVGHLAAFLASDKAGFITGITIQVDGGMAAHFPDYAEELDEISSALS